MDVRLYAMTCGWLSMQLGDMLEGETGILKIPVPAYLIVHPKGNVLFDTGLHASIQKDPQQRLGKVTKLFEFYYEPGEDLAARLESLDTDPGKVRYIVNSHLHFDHCGGNEAAPNASLIIQRPEWQAAHDADLIRSVGYMRQDYDTGQDVIQIDGERDLFGDGAVTCIPTYGHTPGHQSLRVRLPSGEVVLTGDACYLRRSLEEMRLPRFVHNREQMLRAFRVFKDLQSRGARIFYGHDPEFWRDVPQAPAQVA